ncbi:MAG: immunoglobulin domain-containing protein [Planctomycetes bacterium]|nr:immunoglobulin domain-containing protein [Planctomycetota bacterium]
MNIAPIRRSSRLSGMALRAIVMLAGAASPPVQAQSFYNIPPMPNLQTSWIGGLSGDGNTVVGWSWNGPDRAYRWTVAGGRQEIPLALGGYESQALGVSDDGNVIAVNLRLPNGWHGYKWTAAGGYQDLGVYGSGQWQTISGVSRDGLTFFGQTHRWLVSSGSSWAYRWTPSGGFQIFPPPAGYGDGYAMASNYNGSYIGGQLRTLSSGNGDAMRWDAAGNRTYLGTLPNGGLYDLVKAMSNDGLTVVGSSAGPGLVYRAFRWRDLGGGAYSMEDLGRLPGTTQAFADAVTREGSVVLGSCTGGGADKAFMFAGDIGMIDLFTWLPAMGFNISGFLNFNEVSAVSNDGTVIAGTGNYGGERRAWVARGIPCMHKPTILSSPTDQGFCFGGTATFSTSAGGTYTGNLTYAWLKDGVLLSNGPTAAGGLISGANSPTITIANAQGGDSGVYECWVSNRCGGAASGQATLNVTPGPTFDYLPFNTSVCVNNVASLGCQASPYRGTTYQWYRYYDYGFFQFSLPVSDGVTSSGTTITGSQSPTMLFSNTKGDVAGSYWCYVTGTCATAATPIAVLSVLAGPPVITTQPFDSISCAAGPAPFSVVVPASNGPYTYQWYHETSPNVYAPVYDGPTGGWGGCGFAIGSGTATLTLTGYPNMLDADGVKFRCVVINACGPTNSLPAQLTICPGDFNCDGGVDGGDVTDFYTAWGNGDAAADLNCDGGVDNGDVQVFFAHWSNGC